MDFKPLEIEGAYLITPEVHSDNRGNFREWFKEELLNSKTGSNFSVSQANLSTSKKGVIRGIHLTNGINQQSKYVTCINGRILDVIVDLRSDSDTYLNWISLELFPNSGTSVYLTEGLGHAFMALEDDSSLMYLVNESYDPKSEVSVNAMDKSIGIEWPNIPPILSSKDSEAPSILELTSLGILPMKSKK
jgi:dTDP-4-dehydrorhamnose 3,5-epimerase